MLRYSFVRLFITIIISVIVACGNQTTSSSISVPPNIHPFPHMKFWFVIRAGSRLRIPDTVSISLGTYEFIDSREGSVKGLLDASYMCEDANVGIYSISVNRPEAANILPISHRSYFTLSNAAYASAEMGYPRFVLSATICSDSYLPYKYRYDMAIDGTDSDYIDLFSGIVVLKDSSSQILSDTLSISDSRLIRLPQSWYDTFYYMSSTSTLIPRHFDLGEFRLILHDEQGRSYGLQLDIAFSLTNKGALAEAINKRNELREVLIDHLVNIDPHMFMGSATTRVNGISSLKTSIRDSINAIMDNDANSVVITRFVFE